MRAFLSDIILRPSCYNCPTKQGKSHSDITIADFWGINNIDPSFDDNKGCGLIFANTTKGDNAYSNLSLIAKEKTFEEGIKYNSAYYQSSRPHPNRGRFFKNLDKAEELSAYILRMQKPTFATRVKNKIKRYTKAIIRRLK